MKDWNFSVSPSILRNEADEAVISSEGSRVTVRVIHTDEESEIARSVLEMISAES